MSATQLKDKLVVAKKAGRLPKIVVPVHFAGHPTDQERIWSLAQEFSFKVLEDASHSIGASRNGEPVGNCRWSDATVFSFHPVKIITTGEGGMALTNDKSLAKRMQLLRSHGITRDVNEMTHAPDGPWFYQQIDLGYNYRMTDIQAALGISQMQRLDEFVTKRHSIAKRYDQLLADLPVITPWQHADSYPGLHLYVIRLKLKEIVSTHRQVFEALRAAGIGVNLHYIPVYTQPYYKGIGFQAGHCPEAEKYYAEAISLPMYLGLTEEQQASVVRALREATQG
jgi:dTDP-4-amino-4,6-dideoxygalactose transaminase